MCRLFRAPSRFDAANATGAQEPAPAHSLDSASRSTARLCVASQRYGTATRWLKNIPGNVLCCSESRIMKELRIVLECVPRPTSIRFQHDSNVELPCAVFEALADEEVGSELKGITVRNVTLPDAAMPLLATLTALPTNMGLKLVATPCLTRLLLGRSQCVTDNGLIAVAGQLTALRELVISNTKLGNKALMAVAKKCPLLQDLDVSGTSRVSDPAIKVVAQHCPQLRTLNVSNTGGRVTDGSIGVVGCSCPKMAKLNVAKTSGWVTDASIPSFGLHCPDLEHIDVSGNNGSIQVSLPELVQRCERLRSLKMGDDLMTDVSKRFLHRLKRGRPGIDIH